MTADVDHASRAHALLGASSAKQWMTCTPSARLADKYPNTSSIYAEEGTTAHEYAELLLTEHFGFERPEIVVKGKHKIFGTKFYNAEFEFYARMYVDYVLNAFTSAKNTDPYAMCLTEQRVDFSAYVQDGFGTLDLAIFANRTLLIGDLKFGKGQPVTAVENDQLKLYAIGFILTYLRPQNIEVDRIILLIHQPRIDNVSMYEISPRALFDWAENEVKPKAALAWKGEGKLVAGEHCRFCRAKPECALQQQQFAAVAQAAFGQHYDADYVLRNGDAVIQFISAVKARALENALAGQPPAGYKVIRSSGRRSWTSPYEAEKFLRDAGFNESDIVTTAVKPLTHIEKLIGKKDFAELCDHLIQKNDGIPSLVPENNEGDVISNADAFTPLD